MLALLLLAAEPLVAEVPLPGESGGPAERAGPGPRLSPGREAGTPTPPAASQTAIDAERAFAADAQTLGQWAAFRKWAAPNATMFVPQPVDAQAWLKDRPEPAKAVEWWPTASWMSCDGSLAANTDSARWPDGHAGYFSTIWARQPDGGWRWRLDHGDDLPVARQPVSSPAARRAACGGKLTTRPSVQFRCAPQAGGTGGSTDGTMVYQWALGGCAGGRSLWVWVWNGSGWDPVLGDRVPLERGL